MTEENQSTPDVSSGQGDITPDVASGQGTSDQNTDVATGQTSATPPEADWQQRFNQQSHHFNQKITEMGQTNAQLQQQMEAFQKREQALAQVFGGQTAEASPDVLSQLVEDPEFLTKTVEQKAREIAAQEVTPIRQMLEAKEVAAFAAEQTVEKSQVLQDLSGIAGEDVAKKIVENINVSHLVSPEIHQLNQRVQNDPLMSPQDRAQAQQKIEQETWKALQQAGGYRKLAYAALGETLASDPNNFMQSAARTFQANQMKQQRAGAIGQMTGGAESASGGVHNYQSESVFR